MTQSDARLIDLYLDMLAAERGAAANTLEAYRRDLTDFAANLSECGGAICHSFETATTLARHGLLRVAWCGRPFTS